MHHRAGAHESEIGACALHQFEFSSLQLSKQGVRTAPGRSWEVLGTSHLVSPARPYRGQGGRTDWLGVGLAADWLSSLALCHVCRDCSRSSHHRLHRISLCCAAAVWVADNADVLSVQSLCRACAENVRSLCRACAAEALSTPMTASTPEAVRLPSPALNAPTDENMRYAVWRRSCLMVVTQLTSKASGAGVSGQRTCL